jgi:hypothetical protein
MGAILLAKRGTPSAKCLALDGEGASTIDQTSGGELMRKRMRGTSRYGHQRASKSPPNADVSLAFSIRLRRTSETLTCNKWCPLESVK